MNPFSGPIRPRVLQKVQRPRTFEQPVQASSSSSSASSSAIVNPGLSTSVVKQADSLSKLTPAQTALQRLKNVAELSAIVKPDFWMFRIPEMLPPGAIHMSDEEIEDYRANAISVKVLNAAVAKIRNEKPARTCLTKKTLAEFVDFEVMGRDDVDAIATDVLQRVLSRGKEVKIAAEIGFVVDGGKQFYPSANTNFFGKDSLQTCSKRSQVLSVLRKITDIPSIDNAIGELHLNSSGHTVVGIYRYRIKLFYTQIPIGKDCVAIPEFIKSSKNYVSMASAKNNTCFWQCLALFLNPKMPVDSLLKEAYKLMDSFYKRKLSLKDRKEYVGVVYPDELAAVENHFCVGVNVWVPETKTEEIERMRQDLAIHRPCTEDLKNGAMDVVMIEQSHFCFMRAENKKHVHSSYKCSNCPYVTDHRKAFADHMKSENGCKNVSEKKQVFPKDRGVWKGFTNNLILKELGKLSKEQQLQLLNCTENEYQQKFNDFCVFEDFLVFDFESASQASSQHEFQHSKNLKILNKHEPTTYQIFSDTTKLITGMVDECGGNSFELVSRFVEDLLKCAEKIQQKLSRKYESLLQLVQRKKNREILEAYIKQVPVCGYNSSNYDINMIIPFGFIQRLKEKDCNNNKLGVILAGRTYKNLSTDSLRFVDINSFTAPGVSLKKFMETYKTTDSKLVIDYSYSMNPKNWSKLFPPPHDECRNILRMEKSNTFDKSERSENAGERMSDKDYATMVAEGLQLNCRTVRDYLLHYMRCDVEPFHQAVKRHFKLFSDASELTINGVCMDPIDPIKECFGIPSLSAIWGNRFAHLGLKAFTDPIEDGGKLLDLDRNKVQVKIASYVESDSKKQTESKTDKKTVFFGSVCDLDYTTVNSSFHAQQGQCIYCREKLTSETLSIDRKTNILGHTKGNFVISCIKCNTSRSDSPFEFYLEKHKEKRYTANTPLVRTFQDEVDDQECYFRQRKQVCGGLSLPVHRLHRAGKTRIRRAFFNTQTNKLEYSKNGDIVTCVISYDANSLYPYAYGGRVPCEFVRTIRSFPEGEECFLRQVVDGKVFGFVTVDIAVPKHLMNFYSDYPPFFVTTDIPNDPSIIGEVNFTARSRQTYSIVASVEEQGKFSVLVNNDEKVGTFESEEVANQFIDQLARQNLSKDAASKSFRKLTSVFSANKIMLATDLLQWYIKKFGIECVSAIHCFDEFTAGEPYSGFVDFCANKRRSGGSYSEIYKLLLNSFFGKSVQNNEHHATVRYADANEYLKLVIKNTFAGCEIISGGEKDEDLFEIEMEKRKVKHDVPHHLGFYVYQKSKLRMLEFMYDFLAKYLNRDKYQLMYTDTDSLWIAFAGHDLNTVKVEDYPDEKTFQKAWTDNASRTLSECVKKDYINSPQYLEDYKKFIVCNKFDEKTPGLFKIEFIATDACFNGPKMYAASNLPLGKTKSGGKGFNAAQNANLLNVDVMEKTIRTQTVQIAVNRGFRIFDHCVHTYHAEKIGVGCVNDKRFMMDDGVTSYPLFLENKKEQEPEPEQEPEQEPEPERENQNQNENKNQIVLPQNPKPIKFVQVKVSPPTLKTKITV